MNLLISGYISNILVKHYLMKKIYIFLMKNQHYYSKMCFFLIVIHQKKEIYLTHIIM